MMIASEKGASLFLSTEDQFQNLENQMAKVREEN